MTISSRRQKALALMSAAGVDALVLCRAENLRYLCGFTGSDGALVLSPDELVFLTDSRYTTQAREQVAADRVAEYKVKADGIVAQLQQCAATRIGFEADLAYSAAMDLQGRAGNDWQWFPLKDELQGLRLHKTADEIDAISVATGLNAAAFAEIRGEIKPGAREKELSLALEFALRRRGADEKAFGIIVASGPRGALPHGLASERLLQRGELVTLDFGCRCEGYHSDETVTLALGSVSDELRKIHDVVLQAHDLALAAVKPGIPLAELDRVAREAIHAAGYGDFFGHGLGHGVGLEVHEPPTVSPRSTLSAENGMVFTIEPGIYVPGLGGVRIEDMVLVTAEGYRLLTKISKTFDDCLLH